jgi:hypothetical protein
MPWKSQNSLAFKSLDMLNKSNHTEEQKYFLKLQGRFFRMETLVDNYCWRYKDAWTSTPICFILFYSELFYSVV